MKIMLLAYAQIHRPYKALGSQYSAYKLTVKEKRLFGLWKPIRTTIVEVPYSCNADHFYKDKLNVWIDA